MKRLWFLSWFSLLTVSVSLLALGTTVGFWRVPALRWFLSEPEPTAVAPSLEPECLGRVDVEGGVLQLAPLRPGQIVEIPAREGEEVSAGAVLLKLDDQPARIQMQQAQAAQESANSLVALAQQMVRLHPSQVAAAEALVTAAQRRVAAAREDLQQKERLHGQRLISREELAAVQEQVKALEAVALAEEKKLDGLRGQNPTLQVSQAQAEVARTEALLAEARYALSRCQVLAPERGTVLQVLTGVGEIAGPQQPAIRFAPARPRIVRAEVEQEFIHLVQPGQTVVVRDGLRPEITWQGKVARIGEWFADPPSLPRQPPRFADVATVECVIALESSHPPLRIGQRVTVQFRTGSSASR